MHALTGIDTDRLPEERARGISIALGYALLRTPAGRPLSVVDVPGHERFVRTMVAGASGIDLFLMVVAADDGVMPQTIEHATVLRALGVKHGVVAITKTDLTPPSSATEQASRLFPGCEVVPCSSRRHTGLDELLGALDRAIDVVTSRAASRRGIALHIDRVFTIRGHGTVVTGTLSSGSIQQGDTLTLLPGGARIRVRALEVHGVSVTCARAGQRVAVNLAGTRLQDVRRGYALTDPDALHETVTLDCALTLSEGSRNARVQVHHGTRDAPGRMVSLGEDLWQLRLERPLLAAQGDRIVIRTPAPPDTIGGGIVLDPRARPHGRHFETLERLRRQRDGVPEPPPQPKSPEDDAPLQSGADKRIAPSSPQDLTKVLEHLKAGGLHPMTQAQLGVDLSVLMELRSAGSVVCVRGKLFLDAETAQAAQSRVVEMLREGSSMSLAEIRDVLGASRKGTQALLEYLDTIGVTRRLPDDRRMLSRSHRAAGP